MDNAVRTTGRLRLAAELRRLRDLSGVSGRELARRIAISQSKVSRIESGAILPSLPEVTAWGAALDAPEEVRQRLISLTNAAFTEIQPWREVLRGQGHLQDEIQEREEQAQRIRTFQPSVTPGLLQTAEYARRVFTMFQLPYAEEDLSAAVAARLHRQQLVFDESKQLDFLITEAALRWRPGPSKVLLAQWDRIRSIGTLHNVSIGLIPHHQEATTMISHGFVIYDSLEYDQNRFVTVEMVHASVTVNNPSDVSLYEQRWSLLQQMAIYGDQANDYLTSLAGETHVGSE